MKECVLQDKECFKSNLKLEIIYDIVKCYREGKISEKKMKIMLKKLG
ncbi:hypothetical protein [Tepidibacter formicigenes]|jgi:hypothetical protein|uniref:Uncharacterized protein n=1 Tax=Tepidibacter formicigenes DSM 15518 TaxID=1123349 RepID=A0A1M6NW64_9FIRM|nr:hypothetical protein [Tepidibacter formicigenes]SHJ99935.1 hypothetical protein SAMN02744037_01386 [Tepidibacter formicigenes DSM 15518]